MTETTNDEIRAAVREQYGKVARGDLGCCGVGCGPNPEVSASLGYSPEDLEAVGEGANLGLGCGNPRAIAALSEGEAVLDLGSGAGFDSFLAARQVGPRGRVVGVDMTPEMIARARDNAITLAANNVEFRIGEIEHLPVADATIDVVLSNCVINLSPDKSAVFREAFRVLRAGGRLAISDVVAIADVPEAVRGDMVARTGCVAGAAPVADIEALLAEAGFEKIRVSVDPRSHTFVADWMPGSGIENFVASATIEAIKPGDGSCCAPSCCSGDAAS